MNKLSYKQTFAEAFEFGMKNVASILGATVLYVLTCWIPYLNVGTTIAMAMLPVQLAKGEVINPLSIFDAQYRREMGNFLLLCGLMVSGLLMAACFCFVPAIVLSYAWSLAIYYLIACDKNPLEALKASNKATYGNKWTIFFVQLSLGLGILIVSLVLGALATATHMGFVRLLVMLLVLVIAVSISIAVEASIWKQLKENAE